ncbi:hypothetical protein HZA26_02055 [Candidatus Nomurabacteria bacterium]|nr:hypothetical protein [Candidatus Nomurabacteria bacterium]
MVSLIGGLIFLLSRLPKQDISKYSNFAAYLILFSIIVIFIGIALRSRINVYESFIDGAKEGFQVAIGIVPYLIGILVAIPAVVAFNLFQKKVKTAQLEAEALKSFIIGQMANYGN